MKEMRVLIPSGGCPRSLFSFSVINAALLSSTAMAVSEEDMSVATSFLQRRCSLKLAAEM